MTSLLIPDGFGRSRLFDAVRTDRTFPFLPQATSINGSCILRSASAKICLISDIAATHITAAKKD